MTKEMKELLSSLPDIQPPPPIGKEDWVYRDLRWFTEETYKQFLDVIGVENLMLICGTQRKDKQGNIVIGGQFFVSPQAIKNAEEYTNNKT